MIKKRIYISGNVNGSPEKTKQKFMDAELHLGKYPNYEVFNSYELGFAGKLAHEDAKEWFELMLSCDAIFLLDGWFYSERSVSEKAIMQDLNKVVLYERKTRLDEMFDKTQRLRHTIHEVTGHPFSFYHSKGRERERCDARTIFIYYSFKHLGLRQSDLAKLFKQHHSNISHAVNKYDELRACDNDFARLDAKVQSLLPR